MEPVKIEQLSEAFRNFSAASRSLETHYAQLQEKIAYLTKELEQRNVQLSEALADAERSKDYLKAVVYNLDEAIIVTDPKGIVATMNRAAEGLFGMAAEAALGRPFTTLGHEVAREGPDTVLTVGSVRRFVILSESGVIDADGRLRGTVILIRDITRLRELEQRHERDQRLIAMGEMAAKIVHEIRNPLCSMELFATMLEKDAERPEQRELARGISAGIGTLNAIMTNMLFFARPNKPKFRPVRLDATLEEALGMIAPMLAPRKIGLVKALAPVELRADAELLKQVFLNVLMNAVQAMPEGGTLTAGLQSRDGVAAVSVADTGVGIPKEHLESIFDPFFTTKDNGTGLGLVIASNLMRANGGYIEVESEPGKGSSFRLCFPVAAALTAGPQAIGQQR